MSGSITQFDGWWWPEDDTDGRAVIVPDCAPAIAALLPHIDGRDLIVQAGANVGYYPVALDKLFNHVFTTEADPTNYACLAKNIVAHRDAKTTIIFPSRPAALGAASGLCAPVHLSDRNCGAHRVDYGSGDIPVMTIDSMRLPRCDAIWLDIEGAELLALQGAERVISEFSPTICVEDKGLHRAFGIADGALRNWLTERGYVEVDRIGNDKIFRRTP